MIPVGPCRRASPTGRSFARAACAALLAIAIPVHAAPSISAGKSHSLAVKADGTARAWGDDSAGELGAGRLLASAEPVTVRGLAGVVAAAPGHWHILALAGDGTVWAWGRNGAGELGDGSTTSRPTAARVAGLSNVVAIAAGWYHLVAL